MRLGFWIDLCYPLHTMEWMQRIAHHTLKVPAVLAIVVAGLFLEFVVTFPLMVAYHLDRLLTRR